MAATASKLDVRATALLMPEAIPVWSAGAEASTAVVSGATRIVSPMPNTMPPPMISSQKFGSSSMGR